MPRPMQAIVFDFDGVLFDSEPAHFAALRDVAATLGVTLDQPTYDRHLIGYDDRDAFRAIASLRRGGPPSADGVSLDPDELADLCRRKQAAFDAIVAEGIDPLPGVRELLDQVCGTLPIAIASGATRQDIDGMLASQGWTHRFPVIVSADEVTRSKPHPATYALAVERLAAGHGPDLAPHDCLAIEDTPAGIASAQAAGLHVLGVATTNAAAALHRADRVVPGLAGVGLDAFWQWFGRERPR